MNRIRATLSAVPIGVSVLSFVGVVSHASEARADDVTVETIEGDSDKAKFEADVKARLQSLDARISAITSLYDKGPATERDRMSERMKTATIKRGGIDTDMDALKSAAGDQWTILKADVVLNMKLLDHALDDLEFVFKH